jgi:hypothetical protein
MKSPYNPKLREALKGLNGKWDDKTGAWVFDIRTLSKVFKTYDNVYGEHGEHVTRVNVEMTALEEISVTKGAIYAGPRFLCKALGRDSSIVFGSDVVIVSTHNQGARSSGSTENWKTVILKDTEVWIYDLPETAVKSINKKHWRITIHSQAETDHPIQSLPVSSSVHQLEAQLERNNKQIESLKKQITEYEEQNHIIEDKLRRYST